MKRKIVAIRGAARSQKAQKATALKVKTNVRAGSRENKPGGG